MCMGLAATADRQVQILAQRHQEHARDAVGGSDDDETVGIVQRRADGADPVEAGGDCLAIPIAVPRQAHSAVNPVDQPRPKSTLKVLDGTAHGRLRRVKFRGGGETAEPGSAFERTQVTHRRERREF